MFIVATYDISDDRRRVRIHKAFSRYGEPSQYSLFECIIDSAQFEEMKRKVSGLIEAAEDSVRFYEVCDGCRRNLISLGRSRTASIPFTYVY